MLMLRVPIVCISFVGLLPELGLADTYDIGVTLYNDMNCLNFVEDLILLDNGCYANKWAPNGTKGYKMNIVFFNKPERIDMREYLDDCHTLAMPKRTVTTSKEPCFPFLGSMYARFDTRFRSNTCEGEMCSNLKIAVQTFFSQAECTGPAHSIFRYPVGHGDCMRAFNGTQTLIERGGNVTLTDYSGSDECKAQTGARVRTYSIRASFCYPLYTTRSPRSFSWRVEAVQKMSTTADAYRLPPPILAILVLLACSCRSSRLAR